MYSPKHYGQFKNYYSKNQNNSASIERMKLSTVQIDQSEMLVASLFMKHFHACNSFIYQFNNEIQCGVLCYSVLRFLVNSFFVFSVLSIHFFVAADLFSWYQSRLQIQPLSSLPNCKTFFSKLCKNCKSVFFCAICFLAAGI
jgi:hypothetical protein